MLTLQLGIGAGNDGTGFTEPESELPEQTLTLPHAQVNPIAALHNLRERLAVPEISAQPSLFRRPP